MGERKKAEIGGEGEKGTYVAIAMPATGKSLYDLLISPRKATQGHANIHGVLQKSETGWRTGRD